MVDTADVRTVLAPNPGPMTGPGTNQYLLGEGAPLLIDIAAYEGENVARVAEATGRAVNDVTVVVLERERHDDLIAELRESGARVNLIRDGDVAPSIAAAQPGTGVDMLMGIGGTPEGVISAAAIKCLGGAF